MTANIHAILVGLLSVAHTPEQADHAAREVLNQHAHQLAEQQREDIDLTTHSGESDYLCEDCAVVRAAASIDPEAQR